MVPPETKDENYEYDRGWTDGYEYGVHENPPGIFWIYALVLAIGVTWGIFLVLVMGWFH